MPRPDRAETVNKSIKSLKGSRNVDPRDDDRRALRREMVEYYKNILLHEMQKDKGKNLPPHQTMPIPSHLEDRYDQLSGRGTTDRQIREILKKQLIAHLEKPTQESSQ